MAPGTLNYRSLPDRNNQETIHFIKVITCGTSILVYTQFAPWFFATYETSRNALQPSLFNVARDVY